jgi:glucose-1-phosphate thymidylyltransferase
MPHTLDHAWPFLRRRRIALGFPDVLLEPATVFQELLARGDSGEADVVLALFPAAEPARSDLVATNAEGRVLEVVVKRPESRLRRTWMAAVWSPRFTDHLHRSLAGPPLAGPRKAGGAEVQLGELIQSALGAGLAVDAVDFPGGAALDIGTPKSLARARLGALGRQTPHPQAPKTARDERS